MSAQVRRRSGGREGGDARVAVVEAARDCDDGSRCEDDVAAHAERCDAEEELGDAEMMMRWGEEGRRR